MAGTEKPKQKKRAGKLLFLMRPKKQGLEHKHGCDFIMEINKINPTAWAIESYFPPYIPESLLACSRKLII